MPETKTFALPDDDSPRISVIVPVYNGEKFLPSCLNALRAATSPADEIIVVNDASTDNSAAVAQTAAEKVHTLAQRTGPAAARNHGAARAGGEVLFFVDADVVVKEQTIERVRHIFQHDREIAAVFGSYDEEPAERNFVSQYKNLYHHYIHQQASAEASTFWAGCGAIRSEVFAACGGFDARSYPEPSIEDIELGARLTERGYRIRLDQELQVKHLKKWTLWSLVRTDIFQRAVPWSLLMLERRQVVADLNLQTAHRVSAVLSGVFLLALLLTASDGRFTLLGLSAALCAAGGILYLNRSLYSFFLAQRGAWFALRAFPLNVLYYLYSGTVFVMCWVGVKVKRLWSGELAAETQRAQKKR